MFGEVSYLMNPGSLTTVQLVGVEKNIQTKEYTCIQLLCLCLRFSFEVKVFFTLCLFGRCRKGLDWLSVWGNISAGACGDCKHVFLLWSEDMHANTIKAFQNKP